VNRIEVLAPAGGPPSGFRAALRRWVADDTPLKRVLTAQRWMSRAYFEARYLMLDPWGIASSPYERERTETSLRVLEGRRYPTALEVGCGEGVFTARLLDRCDRILAVDISSLAVRRARRRLAGNPRVAVARLDVRVDDPGAAFDLVVCAELFYYWNRRQFDEAAARIAGWVAPGGDLFLVHGTSVHDAGGGGSGTPRHGEMSARVIHERFSRMPDLAVIYDVTLPRYRLTLLRRRRG